MSNNITSNAPECHHNITTSVAPITKESKEIDNNCNDKQFIIEPQQPSLSPSTSQSNNESSHSPLIVNNQSTSDTSVSNSTDSPQTVTKENDAIPGVEMIVCDVFDHGCIGSGVLSMINYAKQNLLLGMNE